MPNPTRAEVEAAITHHEEWSKAMAVRLHTDATDAFYEAREKVEAARAALLSIFARCTTDAPTSEERDIQMHAEGEQHAWDAACQMFGVTDFDALNVLAESLAPPPASVPPSEVDAPAVTADDEENGTWGAYIAPLLVKMRLAQSTTQEGK